jgi:hypothetical protein
VTRNRRPRNNNRSNERKANPSSIFDFTLGTSHFFLRPLGNLVIGSSPLSLPRGIAARGEPSTSNLAFFNFGGATSSFSDRPPRNHHRRRSSVSAPPSTLRLGDHEYLGVQSHKPLGPLSPIPGMCPRRTPPPNLCYRRPGACRSLKWMGPVDGGRWCGVQCLG